MKPDPLAAFEVVLAGNLAEDGAFGHHLRQGWVGDIRMWVMGAGLTDAMSAEDVEQALGTTVPEAEASSKEWVLSAYPRIRDVAQALGGASDERTVVGYDTGPWSMPYDEIVTIATP